MQLSNDGVSWAPAQPYGTSASWTLLPGDGLKTVSTRFVDGGGNLSAVVTAPVTLDATAPAGTILINNGSLDDLEVGDIDAVV